MIGFECPWCDHQISLSPEAFTDEVFVCAACNTRIELSVGPDTQVSRIDRALVGLPLAA